MGRLVVGAKLDREPDAYPCCTTHATVTLPYPVLEYMSYTRFG